MDQKFCIPALSHPPGRGILCHPPNPSEPQSMGHTEKDECLRSGVQLGGLVPAWQVRGLEFDSQFQNKERKCKEEKKKTPNLDDITGLL